MQLKQQTIDRIEKLIPRYPEKRSAVVMALHAIQEDQGFICKEALEWVAARLEMEPVSVYELLTFYPMFRDKPMGKFHVKVCRTLSCALRGAYKVSEIFQQELGCKLGETTSDNNFTVEFVECLGCCGSAAVVQINEEFHENVTPEKARQLAVNLREEAGIELVGVEDCLPSSVPEKNSH